MRTRISVLSLFLIGLGGAAAHAHAFLDHASPLVGSTVHIRAARGLADVYARPRTGVQLGAGDRRKRRACRSGQGASQRHNHAHRPKIARGRYLPRPLARALGRHAQNRGKLLVSGGRPLIGGATRSDGRTRVDDPLIYVRAIHFGATITVAGVAFFIVFIAEPAFREDRRARACQHCSTTARMDRLDRFDR